MLRGSAQTRSTCGSTNSIDRSSVGAAGAVTCACATATLPNSSILTTSGVGARHVPDRLVMSCMRDLPFGFIFEMATP
jgi:hypothetical protein